MKIEQDPALEPEVPGDPSTGEPTTTDPQVEEETAEPSGKPGEGVPEEPGEKSEEHEIILTGEEEETPPAPKDSVAWARLRKQEREARMRAAELEKKLQALQAPTGAPEPGPEPTLESCDFDGEKFKTEFAKHLEVKARRSQYDAQVAEQAEASRKTIQARMDAYAAAKRELATQVPDYADAEAAVIAALSPAHQDALLKATDNAALVVCALGQRPTLLEEFAKETDRDRFIAKLAKLEAKISMKKKGTQAPPPEKPVRGTGALGAGDSHLEKLRARAAKSGDYTEVNAYKRQQRQQK